MLVWVHTKYGKRAIETNTLVPETIEPFEVWSCRTGIDFLSDRAMYETYIRRVIEQAAAMELPQVSMTFNPPNEQQNQVYFNLTQFMRRLKDNQIIYDGKVVCDGQNNTPFVTIHFGLAVTLFWQFTPLVEHSCSVSNLEFLG